MKKVAVVALFVGFVSSNALGGLVTFDPSGTSIDRTVDAPVFTVDMYAGQTTLDTFDAVDFVVGSNDGLDLTDFVIDPSVTAFFSTINNPGPGIYGDDIKVGWFGTPNQPGAILGTLTVDTTGLADGIYDLVINADIDGGQSKFTSGLDVDMVMGEHRVVITPEPATLSLLGLAALGFLRRRRMA